MNRYKEEIYDIKTLQMPFLLNSDKQLKEKEKKIIPFLNWAGGKRWLASNYISFFPEKYNKYIEPFLGSGAVFFNLKPKKSILSDLNDDLVRTYISIKENWKSVERLLRKHHNNHSTEYYYNIRKIKPKSNSAIAAKFIYLNRTCWNGLYRVNLKNEFNVPVGTKKNVILDTDNFGLISSLLENSEIYTSDFEKIISMSQENDLIFADPPYTVKHNNNNFIKYNDKLFNWDDQIRLKDCLLEAKGRGSLIILTNANHSSIRELYGSDFSLYEVFRNSLIASESKRRGVTSELLIMG